MHSNKHLIRTDLTHSATVQERCDQEDDWSSTKFLGVSATALCTYSLKRVCEQTAVPDLAHCPHSLLDQPVLAVFWQESGWQESHGLRWGWCEACLE